MLSRTFVLVVLLFAPLQAGAAQGSGSAPAIAALRSEWVSNLHQKRLEQFVMMYAPDATFIGGGRRFTGRSAIRGLTKNIMDSFTSDIELRSISTEFSGDLAYESGDYRETLTAIADGSKRSIRGDYLTIYKRSADRKWLIVQQMWTEVSPSSDEARNAQVLSEVSKYYAVTAPSRSGF